MTQTHQQVFTLLDSDYHSHSVAGQVYLWDGYVNSDKQCSILSFCDEHADRLRKKYCKWIHDLGESRTNEKRLIDYLAFGDGFSYWWMTLLVEKSSNKSPISDAIRLLALEEVLVQQRPEKFKLVSENQCLHETLEDLCQNLGIAYEWEQLPNLSLPKWNLKRIFHALPHSARALTSLVRHAWSRWQLRKTEKSGWFGGDKALLLCSYFSNVDPDLARKGNFHSHYWEGLHDLMRKLGISGNWLQHYIPYDAVPNPRVARDLLQRFNLKSKEQGFHAFLDAYLSWGILLRVLRRWLKLRSISKDLKEIKQAFRPYGSGLSFWPLMRENWKASMCGQVAIQNLLLIELFDKALFDMPHQKKGLYLCENQAWERALIHAWRKHGHGQLIAVPHSTRSFWDLRFSHDSNTLKSSLPFPMPQADLTALNGRAAMSAYLGEGYSKETIVECEALRYGYLNKIKTGSRKDNRIESIKVLILGDYMTSCTINMLQLLEAALPQIASATYTMKPHPDNWVNTESYPALNLKVVMDQLEKILYDFDVVFSSNLTSASVDAYLVGLPVVVMLDQSRLNLSPLRGQPGAYFVSTSEELAEAIHTAHHENKANRPDTNDFFFLDPELPKWFHLLTN